MKTPGFKNIYRFLVTQNSQQVVGPRLVSLKILRTLLKTLVIAIVVNGVVELLNSLTSVGLTCGDTKLTTSASTEVGEFKQSTNPLKTTAITSNKCFKRTRIGSLLLRWMRIESFVLQMDENRKFCTPDQRGSAALRFR